MFDHPNENIATELAEIKRALNNLKNGFRLLGIVPCSKCGTFFRRAGTDALFDCGELICAECVYEWWLSQSPQISVKEREIIERKLVNWLITHHQATVIQHKQRLPECSPQERRMVITCSQCNGTGQLSGRYCHACDGRGTLWLLIPVRESKPSG